ncbi:MAG: transaldolase [Neisseriaceae bacterium]|nr:transaldolase [Neisseriaceae bacterium]
MNNIQQARLLGQQIWLDSLSRSMIIKGELNEKIRQGASGVTTNPAIFLSAIKNDELYQQQMRALKADGKTAQEIYETMACADVQAACDIFLTEYQYSNGNAGFVSIEVNPALANDTDGTVAEARRLLQTINRPNVMIKIPATAAGIAAVERLAGECNINTTLIFDGETVKKIEQAFYKGNPPANGRIVASVFLSRIDTAIDDKLPAHLQGKTAVAMAQALYDEMKDHTPPAALIAAWQNTEEEEIDTDEEAGCCGGGGCGCGSHHHHHHDDDHECCGDCDECENCHHDTPKVQAKYREDCPLFTLLWASTATKNPAYSDTLYIDNLIGKNTVNTLPEKAMNAFLEHGKVSLINADNAQNILQEVAQYADLSAVANDLQIKGLQQFQAAFDEILAFIEAFE